MLDGEDRLKILYNLVIPPQTKPLIVAFEQTRKSLGHVAIFGPEEIGPLETWGQLFEGWQSLQEKLTCEGFPAPVIPVVNLESEPGAGPSIVVVRHRTALAELVLAEKIFFVVVKDVEGNTAFHFTQLDNGGGRVYFVQERFNNLLGPPKSDESQVDREYRMAGYAGLFSHLLRGTDFDPREVTE